MQQVFKTALSQTFLQSAGRKENIPAAWDILNWITYKQSRGERRGEAWSSTGEEDLYDLIYLVFLNVPWIEMIEISHLSKHTQKTKCIISDPKYIRALCFWSQCASAGIVIGDEWGLPTWTGLFFHNGKGKLLLNMPLNQIFDDSLYACLWHFPCCGFRWLYKLE